MSSCQLFVHVPLIGLIVSSLLIRSLLKVLVFLMVMTFVLHPLSHYNSITDAQFLLSLLEHFTIDFPSYFILSLIDVYMDMTSRDKLIFPLAIMMILCHFSVPFLISNHFHVMCVIDTATVKRSKT